MKTCYILLQSTNLHNSRQILESYGLKASLYKNLMIDKSIKSSLESIEHGSILLIEDFQSLGSSFSDVFHNLNILVKREITLICLNHDQVYSANSPEYSFLSHLYHLKLTENAKVKRTRLDTIKRNNTKPGRRCIYNREDELIVKSLKNTKNLTVKEICQRLKISKSTYYNYYADSA